MRKPVKPQSKLFSPADEIRELYRSVYELNALIHDTDPQARLDTLSEEIEVLRVKASKIRVNYVNLKRRTDKAIKNRDHLQKRLKLLVHRKKVNRLLALAAKMRNDETKLLRL